MTDTVAAPAAAPAAAPVAAPPAPAWHDTMDPTVKGWAATKGYDLSDLPRTAVLGLQGQMNAEKMVGADRAGRTVVLPSDDGDAEGWNKVHTRMGRPDTPAGYELKSPDGFDQGVMDKWAERFHKAGVPKQKGQSLAAEYWQDMAAERARIAAEEEAKLAEEHRALDMDWGTGDSAAVQRELARRGAINLGLDAGAIDLIQKTSGFTKTMKAMAKIGSMTGETPAAGLGTTGGRFSLTPEQAQAALSSKSRDREWGAKAAKAGTPEHEEWKRLTTVVATAAAARG